MKNRDQQLIWEAFDMSRRTFLSVLAKASAALKSGISDVTGVDVADLDKVSKAKPWFKSMTIVADPHEFWGTGDHAEGDIPEVHMGNDTSSDILSQVNKSSKLLDFGDGVIVDVDGSTPYDFKVHVDMNSPFGSLLKVHEEDPDGIEGEDIWRFDWQGGGGMPQDDRIEYAWYQHPVIGPLYKKIGMTLYNDPEWLALQLREHLEYKQSLSKHYTYNNYRELNDMLDSEMKPMSPHQVNIAKMSDAEYMETRILPDYNSMYEEVTGEVLPKETIDIVVSQYSTAIPEGPPPEQQEFDFDKEGGKEFDSDKEDIKKRFIPGPTRELRPHAAPTGLGTFESRMKDKDANLIWEAYEQLSESLSKGDVVRAIVSAWTKSEGDWDTLLDYLGTIRETTNHQTWLAATGDIFRMHHDEVPRELLKALSLMDQASEPVSDVPSINKADSDAPSTTDPSMKKANTAFDIGVWVETLLSRHLTEWEPDDYAYLTDVITALADNKFEPKEAEHHYVEDGDEWLLGDTTEALEYAKVTFTTHAAYIEGQDELPERTYLVAIFSGNTTVDEADRYDLNNIEQVSSLIRAINEAGIEINNE